MSETVTKTDILIDELAEKFLLLDWNNTAQIKEILKLINTFPEKESYKNLINTIKNEINKVLLDPSASDKKTRAAIGSLIEKLHSKIVKEDVIEEDLSEDHEIEIADEDIELYEIFLMEGREILDSIENDIIKLEEDKNNIDHLKSIFRGFHNIKGVAASYQFNNMGKLSHKLEDMLDLARNNKLDINNEFSSIILKGVDILRVILTEAEKGIKDKKILIKKIDDLDIISRVESYIKNNILKKGQPKKTETKPAKKGKEGDIDKMRSSSDTVSLHEALFVKVEISKMDQLNDLAGELVIIENMLVSNKEIRQLENKDIEETMVKLKRITKSLEDVSLKLRMIPIKETFSKLKRIVRDYTMQSGKKINLVIKGEETEIDRNVVEEIYEPLVHLLRNACDHGIEELEDRVQKRKAETGRIELKAFYKGRSIIIDIKDDGKGMDAKKILKKAVQKGIVKPGEKLAKSEIFKLIFQPGFSTADNVTSISGRGVGMDIVLKGINSMQGKIEVKTEIDKGTLIRIILPLTVGIIDGMVVRIGREKFIIPTEYIKRTFQLKPKDYHKVANKGEMIMFQENLLNLFRIDTIFNIEGGVRDQFAGIIITVEGMLRDYCILVDEVIGKQEIVIKALGHYLEKSDGIAGGAILGDGKVGLIIDVSGLENIPYKKE